MPISVLEAMGYGLPVVASNIREIRDIVIDKELLFEVGDSESLCKILSLVLKNVGVHKQYTLEKRGEVLAKYGWFTAQFEVGRFIKPTYGSFTGSTAKVLDGLLQNLK